MQEYQPSADPLTFEKVWALMQETDRQMKESDRKFQETREILDRKFQETREILDRKFQDTDRQMKETDRQMKETDRKFQETTQKMNQTDKQLKELGKQIGGLANKFGSFNEGLVMPSIRKILMQKFGCKDVLENYTFKNNGDILEIDMLGDAEDASYIIEIKSHFRDEAIDQIKTEAAQYKKFSKYAKGKKIYCMLAATHYKETEQKKVMDEGIYFITISDDVAKLKLPKYFKPKEW